MTTTKIPGSYRHACDGCGDTDEGGSIILAGWLLLTIERGFSDIRHTLCPPCATDLMSRYAALLEERKS